MRSSPAGLIESWKGPNEARLVVYRSLPIPGPDPKALSDEMANRLANLPGLRVLRRDVKTVSGRDAAWVEVVAPGNGQGLAPSGTGVPKADDGRPLIPTRQIFAGIPRDSETLWLRWSFPDSAERQIRPQIVGMLEGFRLGGPVVKARTN